jgi:HNH endonuclease
MSVYVSDDLRRKARERAADRCEYCRISAQSTYVSHVPDHIIAVKHRGKTVLSNLAWACAVCNGFKGSDLASIDWNTGRIARLFHPRKDAWEDHFELVGSRILGRTRIGRATAMMLNFNGNQQLALRKLLIHLGIYP